MEMLILTLGCKMDNHLMTVKSKEEVTLENGQVEKLYSGCIDTVFLTGLKAKNAERGKDYCMKLYDSLKWMTGNTNGKWPISVEFNLLPTNTSVGDDIEVAANRAVLDVRGTIFTALYKIYGEKSLSLVMSVDLQHPNPNNMPSMHIHINRELKMLWDSETKTAHCINSNKNSLQSLLVMQLQFGQNLHLKTEVKLSLFPEDDYLGSRAERCNTHLAIGAKIFSEQILPDVEIVCTDGTIIPAHKCFLAAHSDVLATNLQSGLAESTSNSIKIPDMTPAGVRALLAYFYSCDIEEASKDCQIALELVQAAHKYNVRSLESAMRELLLARANTWYNADMALRLFSYARNIDTWGDIKEKSVQVLKGRQLELSDSEAYNKLCTEGNLLAITDLLSVALNK